MAITGNASNPKVSSVKFWPIIFNIFLKVIAKDSILCWNYDYNYYICDLLWPALSQWAGPEKNPPNYSSYCFLDTWTKSKLQIELVLYDLFIAVFRTWQSDECCVVSVWLRLWPVVTAAPLTDHLSYYCTHICVCVRETRLSPALFLCLHQSTVPQPTFSMPVTVPVSNQNAAAAAAALQFSNNPGGALVTTTSFVTSTLTDPRLLSPQQPALQRNTVSPGLPQRPASAGKRGGETQRGRRDGWHHLPPKSRLLIDPIRMFLLS